MDSPVQDVTPQITHRDMAFFEMGRCGMSSSAMRSLIQSAQVLSIVASQGSSSGSCWKLRVSLSNSRGQDRMLGASLADCGNYLHSYLDIIRPVPFGPREIQTADFDQDNVHWMYEASSRLGNPVPRLRCYCASSEVHVTELNKHNLWMPAPAASKTENGISVT